MELTLRRLTFTGAGPTFGVLMKDIVPLCVTLERPWLNNVKGFSCIQPGSYKVIQNTEEKPWRLLDVPGRTEIDIHAGNTIADSEGCILLGTTFYNSGILQSQAAVKYLKSILPETFTLTIVNPIGEST